MKYLLLLFLLAAVLLTAGCGNTNKDTGAVPSPATSGIPVPTLPPTSPPAAVITTTAPPAPTQALPVQREITDGYWCRDTTMNIGKAPTNVKECYQFFEDGTYKWGYSPGKLMGRSPSCSAEYNAKCRYVLGSNGKYEVEGGYSYKLSGDELVDPHDPPYFIYTGTGIP
jgi:hypothetical protein